MDMWLGYIIYKLTAHNNCPVKESSPPPKILFLKQRLFLSVTTLNPPNSLDTHAIRSDLLTLSFQAKTY